MWDIPFLVKLKQCHQNKKSFLLKAAMFAADINITLSHIMLLDENDEF